VIPDSECHDSTRAWRMAELGPGFIMADPFIMSVVKLIKSP
jgi:hypothetical protein